MTVDVEEHFQVSAFESVIPRSAWNEIPSRVCRNTERVLDLFDEVGLQATFFVLGWIAERHPGLVPSIVKRGHEIGCHGYGHRLIYEQDRDVFREETVRARKVLQDLSGQPVSGYRAASFSIDRRSLWALDTLVEAGFRYDSSIFPVVHDRYGVPGAPRRIHRIRAPGGGTLIEVPPATLRLGGSLLPVGGGGYLRLYPSAVTRWAFRRLRRDGIAAVVYVHPWEFDPEQPRVAAPLLSRFRHYVGIESTGDKIRDLGRNFRFGPLTEVVGRAGRLETIAAGGSRPEDPP